MTTDDVRLLFEFNAWANHRVTGACAALTDEQFTRDLGSSYRSVRDTLVHIMGVEWLYFERWHGRSPSALPAAQPYATLASLEARWSEVERDLLTYVRGLSQSDLERVIRYRNIRGNPFAYPQQAMLQHVVNHGTYHRGQITTMLRLLGSRPRETDLLRYHDVLAGQPED